MAVADTKRERIVGRVVNRLHQIRADIEINVYNTEIGRPETVFVWRTGKISPEELAAFPQQMALVVRDLDETKATDGDHTKVNTLSTQKVSRDLHMQIEIVCGGENAPATIRKIIADIETAIRKDIRWRDVDGKPLAIGTRPRIDRSIVEQESLKIGGVVYEFFIHYLTGAFNPYE